jgi:hypothetical protein
MSKAVRYAHLALIAAVISPPILLGQAESGTIVGTVRDPNGSVVPNAAVFLTNQATGFARSATTNNSGQYGASAIPTGTYTISAEAAGFQKLVQSGIVLSTAKTVTADLNLKVGEIKAFANPALYHFGNAGRGILAGPAVFNVDLGVHRDFPLAERWQLSFRAEMFNSTLSTIPISACRMRPSATRCRPDQQHLRCANHATGAETGVLGTLQ